jgi:hypothetical protein
MTSWLPKHVASTTLKDPQWANTTVLSGDVAAAVRELKAQSGRELKAKSGRELQGHGTAAVRWCVGCSTRPRRRAQSGCPPIIVGAGARLFAAKGRDIALELVESRTTPTGVTIQVYRSGGRPEYGTAGVE